MSRDARRVRTAVISGLLLLIGAGCDDGNGMRPDSGTGGGTDGGASACRPSDCDGQPVPAIACADGPTLVVCEKQPDGRCRAQVRCGDPGTRCGGLAGTSCAGDQFCNLEKEAGGDGCENIADGQGVCQTKPSACGEIYMPVCGCDLRSYSNPCEAHAAGVSVLHSELCSAEECRKAGGRTAYSDGASTPQCRADEDSFPIPGRELGLCCVPKR